jgi:PmbA protein
MNEDLLSIASDIVSKARKLGAAEVDALAVSSTESSVQVRMQEVERMVDAGSHAVSIRVIKDKRTAVCSTADLTPKAIDEMVENAVELAKISEPDEHAGLPDREDLALGSQPNLQLYDEQIESVTMDELRDGALRCEQAAFDYDKRVTNSDSTEMSVMRSHVALANSLGFAGSYPSTSAVLMAEAICDDEEGKKRNAYWYSAERSLHRLETAEEVGRKAAMRAVAKIGAKKIETKAMPIVWEAPMTRALLQIIGSAAAGDALYRRSTFLAPLEGERVGSELFTLVDDPLLPGRLGSRPFDGEGVTSRPNAIFERGVFKNFLFDSYYARKLGRRTNGSADRQLGTTPSPGTSNFVLAEGDRAPDELYAGIDDGLLLTDLMGFGVNMTTGDFSRGAGGFRIEKGKVTYPVTEVNVSGNLKEMLAGVEAVANDTLWLGGVAAPSILMSKLMVSGL